MTTESADEILKEWWMKLIYAVVLAYLTWWMHGLFVKLESGVGGFKMPRLLYWAYEAGLRWVVVGFFVLCCVAMLALAVRQIITGKEW